MPSFRVYSQPRDWTQVPHIAGWFFTNWATREVQVQAYNPLIIIPKSKKLCKPKYVFHSHLASNTMLNYIESLYFSLKKKVPTFKQFLTEIAIYLIKEYSLEPAGIII